MSIIDLLRAGSLSRSADEITRLQALVEKAEARAEELTHALARVALDFGADPDILGGLWESSDCIKWMVKVQASLKAKGITIAWGTETHEPVVMDAHAEKAAAQLAEVTSDFKAAMSEMREDAGLGHHELNDNQRQSIQCMIEAYADQYLPSEPTEGAKT